MSRDLPGYAMTHEPRTQQPDPTATPGRTPWGETGVSRRAIELVAACVLGPAVLVTADIVDRGPAKGTGIIPELSAAIEGLCDLSFVGLLGLGVVLGICTRAPVWQLAGASVLAFPLLIIPDLAADPTSHNLFPFELGLYAVLAFVLGAGAVTGRGLRALSRR